MLVSVDYSLSLLEPEFGRRLWCLSTNGYNLAVCSPTDPSLALATPLYPRTSLGLLDLASQSLIAVFTNGRVDAVCFSPDGRQFARWDRQAQRISPQSLPSGTVVSSLETSGYLMVLAFTPDGRTLAGTYEDVVALGMGGYGESNLLYLRGHDPVVLEPPAKLVGLQSFSIRPVIPEPSVGAWLALAGIFAVGMRRYWRNRGG